MDQLRPYRSFVSYIDRSREYYAAQGYPKPYAWPHYDDVPFTPLQKPLSECRVGLVTTAGKPRRGRALGFLPVGAGVVCGTGGAAADAPIHG